MNDNHTLFVPAQDLEEIQSIVLTAAIHGNEICRNQLSSLSSSLEEPYRTVCVTLHEQLLENNYADPQTVQHALAGKRLTRRAATGGQVEQLTPQQVMNLLGDANIPEGKAAVYLGLLHTQLDAKRQAEFKESALRLAGEFGGDHQRLQREIESLASNASRGRTLQCRSERQEFLPYFYDLMSRQTGSAFQGLDSGFQYLNEICNGLDTGLFALAATPSTGKTTLAWQICQQVGAINEIPVIFTSLEQSKHELRVKALARFSKLNSKHISRGRFRADNPDHVQKLLQAAEEYSKVNEYLNLIEGDDLTTIDGIGDLAKDRMTALGADRCLIVVDFLQIIPLRTADAGRVTNTKDRVDLHVTALRRLARRLDSPVMAISSMNRQGYDSKQLDVFKESGGIEYSADIAAVLTVDKEAPVDAQGKFRNVDLNIIKNRNGAVGVVKFKFYPERAEFVETGKADLPQGDGK